MISSATSYILSNGSERANAYKDISLYKIIEKKFAETLANFFFIVYNVECWSLTAMKREVADTPGRFAMADVTEKFSWRMSRK